MKALVVVDVQNDFCPGGGYPIPNGDEVVAPLNKALKYARKNNWQMFASRDWHSEDLFSDESKKHCIKNTKGAEYRDGLDINRDVVIISKGEHTLDESHYSAFNGDTVFLDQELKNKNVSEVYIGGLALDYCVKNTAHDAMRRGYITYVLTDCSKAVKNSQEERDKVLNELTNAGVKLITSKQLVS